MRTSNSGPGALHIAVAVLLIASLGAAGWCFHGYWSRRHQAMDAVQQHIGEQIARAGQDIGKSVANLEHLATEFANGLSSGEISYARSELHARMRETIEQDERIFQFGMAFAPYMHDPGVRLYVPYYRRETPGTAPRLIDEIKDGYDYTLPNDDHAWYHETLAHGPRWNQPYFDEDTEASLIEHTVPFTRQGEAAGVVYINYSLRGLGLLLRSLSLGATSYATIIDGNGNLLYHPIAEYVTKKGAQVAERSDSARILELFARGERGPIPHYDPLTRASALLYLAPIEPLGWVLAVHYFESDLDIDQHAERRDLILAWTAAMVALVCAFILLVCAPAGWSKRSIQLLTAFVSLLLILGICFIWYMSARSHDRSSAIHHAAADGSMERPITNDIGLQQFQETHARSMGANQPVYVPTGVFVQTLAFSGAYTVEVSGYVWQKHPAGQGDGAPTDRDAAGCGFLMPEAATLECKRVYLERSEEGERKGVDRTTTVVWSFVATMRQTFEYDEYPLDAKEVWIRLRYHDLGENVVLVPDLEAYDLMAPHLLPGLEKGLVLEGWGAAETFFDYHLIDYNTNFGVDDYVGQAQFPELHFNIVLRRVFINAFVKNVVPLAVIAIILFATLMTITMQSEKISIFGFNTSGVLAACSGLFFAVLLAHIQLRDTLPVADILYLEYFDFVMYLMILLVSLDAFLFTNGPRLRFLAYENNFLPKVLYWPVLLVTLYAITLATFF